MAGSMAWDQSAKGPRNRPTERRSEVPMLSSAPLAERSHSGLVRRFAKPLKGVSSSEGSNPSLSATAVAHVPVAQWIERQVADLKVGGSSPLGHANPPDRDISATDLIRQFFVEAGDARS